MTQRWRRAVLVLTAAFAFVVVWSCLKSNQPSYQGRSLDSWLRDLDFSSARGLAARAAIRQMGTNALPHLMNRLRHRDGVYKQQLLGFFQLHGIWTAPVENDFEWHRRAARAMRELGPGAGPAVPILAEAVTNSQAPEEVIEALCAMIPASTSVLTNAIVTCKQTYAREKAVKGLMDACHYPEVAEIAMIGLDYALHEYVTEPEAITDLASIREGQFPEAIRQAARHKLELFKPSREYPPNFLSLLQPGTHPTNSSGGELRRAYGP